MAAPQEIRMPSPTLWLLIVLVRSAAGVREGQCNLPGVNVLVSDDGQVRDVSSDTLPALPSRTTWESAGPRIACAAEYDGVIVLGGPSSLNASDLFFSYGLMQRTSIHILLDLVIHGWRHGVHVNGKRYAVHFQWAGDASLPTQVANATARAVRGFDADFAYGGYASGLTVHAARQSYADERIMMAPGASSPGVFSQNNLTFGFLPAAAHWDFNAIAAIAQAAERVDRRPMSSLPLPAQPCFSGGGGCKASIVVAVVQADTTVNRVQAAGLPAVAADLGLRFATDGNGDPLILTLSMSATGAEVRSVLSTLRAAGVNVLITCTYLDAALLIVEQLDELDYSVFALGVSATIGTSEFESRIQSGWWQGEYVCGSSPWHRTNPLPGEYSNMSSPEFFDEYAKRSNGAVVSYHGAAAFAAAASLFAAIEAAGSLETEAVASALRRLRLRELYGLVSFDENGQISAEQLVLQQGANKAPERIVYPPELAADNEPFTFPMPTWAQRRCQQRIKGTTERECSGMGLCDYRGQCVCDVGYSGKNCETEDRRAELGVTLPFSTSSGDPFPLGVQTFSAVYLAIRELNDKADGFADDLLQRTRVYYTRKDSKRDPSTAYVAAFEQATVGVSGKAVSCIIGPFTSDGALKTAEVTQQLLVPQISPSATSEVLSDGIIASYFLRTVPSDGFQLYVMADVLVNLFGYTLCAAVASHTAYAEAGLDSFRAAAEEFRLTLGVTALFDRVDTPSLSYDAELDLLKKANANIIVIIAFQEDAAAFMQAAMDRGIGGPGHFWLGTDAVTGTMLAQRFNPEEERMRILKGYFGLEPGVDVNSDRYKGFEARLRAVAKEARIQELGGRNCSAELTDDGVTPVWAEGDECAFWGLEDTPVGSYAAFAYDAVYAWATAIHELFELQGQTVANGPDLLKTLLSRVSFEGLTGTVEFFRTNRADKLYQGDRRTGISFSLQNYVDNTKGLVQVGVYAPCVECDFEQRLVRNDEPLTFSTADNSPPPPMPPPIAEPSDEDISMLLVAIIVPVAAVLLGVSVFFGMRWYQRDKKHLVLLHTHKSPVLTLATRHNYHIFLSHKWPTGQEQAAAIRRLLQSLLPNVRVFLDVHDLYDLDLLEEYVAKSALFLVFMSRAYFSSTNCQRELREALRLNKPICRVLEREHEHGGAALSELLADAPPDVSFAMRSTDVPEPLRWSRKPDFQSLTMVMIAEALLRASPKYSKVDPLIAVELNSIVARQYILSQSTRVYCSSRNPGSMAAAALLLRCVRLAKHTTLRVVNKQPRVLRQQIMANRVRHLIAHGIKAQRTRRDARRVRKKNEGIAWSTQAEPGRAACTQAVDSRPSGPERVFARVPEVTSPAPEHVNISQSESAIYSQLPAIDALGNNLQAMSHSRGFMSEEVRMACTIQRAWRRSMPNLDESNDERSVWLIYLTRSTWEGKRAKALEEEVTAALDSGLPIVLVHPVNDCRFEHFLETTPRALVAKKLYKLIAIDLLLGRYEEVAAALFLKTLGAVQVNRQGTGFNLPKPGERPTPGRLRHLASSHPKNWLPSHTTVKADSASSSIAGQTGSEVFTSDQLFNLEAARRIVSKDDPEKQPA